MKIAHEAPLTLLSEVRKLTDYDYALVHLFDSLSEVSPEYLDFFKESLRLGRTVILDNSIFELGKSFDESRFAYWVKTLCPTEYIVPDVLEDCDGTISQLHSWVKKYSTLPSVMIGVVQGKTYEDIKRCYLEIDEYCDKIAISFDYSLYKVLFPHKNEIVSWCFGRIMLVNMLLRDGVLNTNKPHHLLGCSSPEEFKFYKDYNFIESLDTSNPIVHGLLKIRYPGRGLWEKKKLKLVELLDSNVTTNSYIWEAYIKPNILDFKKIVK